MASRIYQYVTCPSCSHKNTPSQADSTNGVYAARCASCGHGFKYRAVLPYKASVTFTVDGKEYTVGNEYDPSTVLNTWLRETRVSVGTKHMCFQGGCGACLVEARLYEPVTETKMSGAVNSGGCGACLVEARLYEPVTETKMSGAVNSCLLPLYACDGMEFRTVDHIGNVRDGLHPIQKQIANYNGSQCGYCTPGQVMNMFALKERYGDALTKKQVEDSFDGVICRCTGYRPILKAFKDMATSPSTCKGSVGDIEDIRGKICRQTGEKCSGSCSSDTTVATHMVFADTTWYKPTTEKQLTDILNGATGKTVRFLLGNTSTGVYRDQSAGNYDIVVDPSGLKILYGLSFDTDIIFGAGLTLSDLYFIFERVKAEADLAYLGECANLLMRVANLPIRNRGTWTGNICMKHAHNDFPSDVFVMLQVLKAQVWLGFLADNVSIDDFLKTDITNKVIIAYSFTTLDDDEQIKFYKVTKRAQNAHCYVTGGFRAKVDKTSGLVLKAPIVIAYAGLSASFNRASKTEAYLDGKQLTDPMVLQTALSTLKSELQVDESPVLSSVEYRTNLALSLFYKFVLHLAGDMAKPVYQSGSSELFHMRPISSGVQTYDTVTTEYPVTKPLKKLEANAQSCGEAEYVDDMITWPGQLEGAFVLSTVGNAKIDTIDPTEALKIPGVVKVITAKDIKGVNNISLGGVPEEVLASSTIGYCGQAVALVLADSYGTALGAAQAVKVTYTDVQTPLLDINEAIKQQSFFPKVCDDLVVGDPDKVIADSPKKLSGSIAMGEQYHFHMETQASLCVPNEGGLDVYATTQWIDLVQIAISAVTGMAKNSISVQVKRCGGGYGGKITRNCMISAACGLAADLVNRPVKIRLTLGDNMKLVGKRYPFVADYEVGFTDAGVLNGIKMTYYGDGGISPNDNSLPTMQTWADNAYLCPNWKVSCVAVKTNKSMNTACRSPGSIPAIFIMESLMEHVAKSLGKDATDIRLMNTYAQGAMDPLANMKLNDCTLQDHIATLKTSTNFTQRQQEIATFNMNNRWKKQGISLVPLKFGIDWRGVHYGCQISIYDTDATVAVLHAGIEIGQGINTKVAQVVAYELGIPMELIKVLPSNSFVGANSITTGGSITSENCCTAAIMACNTLNGRIGPVRDKLKDKSWKNVVNTCYNDGIDLCARSWSTQTQSTPFKYFTYGATITEVEFDVLTGEHQLTRSDIQFDCGQSTNPALDVGQVEGAFVMGLGYWLTEELKYDPQTGALVTDSTWEYKPPSSKDIPVDFRVNLYKKSPNPVGVLGAKAVGEPPMCMSCSSVFAIKRAIEAARKDVDQDVFFPLNTPATAEMCQQVCLTDPKDFLLQ